MNIFRLLGDLSHIASILILIHKITTSRSARGKSVRTDSRHFVQDTGAVRDRLCRALPCAVFASCVLPDCHEDLLPGKLILCDLLDEVQVPVRA